LNEADNGLKNVRGAVAMARHPASINSATSQFFVNLVDNPDLDHKDSENDEQYGYCVFGQVVAGMDVVDRIAQVDVHDANMFPNVPVEPVVIESVQRLD
jgi:cyclophilin family peptidyl-prolyl cis-trans isomerase